MIAGPTKSLDLNCDQQHGESNDKTPSPRRWLGEPSTSHIRHQLLGIKNLDRTRRYELCPIVVALHAVDHILLGVRKTPGRQGVRRQCPKAGSVFVHRSHAADISAGACRGVGVDIIGGDLPFVATRIDLLEKTSNAPSSLAWWRQ
jgi:hypothetical protein